MSPIPIHHLSFLGASGGIGLATVQLFLGSSIQPFRASHDLETAEQGARVTAHYNSNSSTLQPLLATYNLSMNVVQSNLTQEQDVITLFNTISSGPFGPPAIAIVNHGVWPSEEVLIKDMSLEQWTNTLNTNLTSSFLVSREYMRHLETASDDVKAKASLTFIGSTAGKYGNIGHVDYSATKSGKNLIHRHPNNITPSSSNVRHDANSEKRNRQDRAKRTRQYRCAWFCHDPDG